MDDPTDIERCPVHPNAEPVFVVVNEIRSAQTDHPARIVREPRCPVCR
jgi:hypothetical protein